MGKPSRSSPKKGDQDTGVITLTGGRGNDLFIVDDTTTEISERKNGGTDTVEASVDYTLSDWLENLVLTGTDPISGTGNQLDNTLTGNDADNTLYGLDGDDTLEGGGGNDVLDGGAGYDIAIFDADYSDYVIEVRSDGIHVSLLENGEIVSTDILHNVEMLHFRDVDVLTSELETSSSPVAEDDHAVLDEDSSFSINVLGNDQGENLSVLSIGAASLGQVTVNADGTITYTPSTDANGEDSFDYTLVDGEGRTSTATVTVSVTPMNDRPEANGENFEISGVEPFTSSVSLLSNDSDPDGDTLSVVAYDNLTQNGGTVTVDAEGNFTYQAPALFTDDPATDHQDSFTYTISDGQGGTAIGTVTLNMAADTGGSDPTSSDPTGGTAPDYVFDALLPGGTGDTAFRWNADSPLGSAVTISFSILDGVPDYYAAGAAERNDFQSLSAEQEAAVRAALDHIESFTNITFVEATGGVGDIAFGTADLGIGSAWAYGPSGSGHGGDVWLNNSVYHDLSLGGDGYKTILHEIGHALGMDHPEDRLPSEESNAQYTVMAYAEHQSSAGVEPSTYMSYDIAALQHLYGANDTDSSGDDVYNLANLNDTMMTIWDSGGWDALDASGSDAPVVLDLTPGGFSSAGATGGGWFALTDNIGTAYMTFIEEAIGGNGDDTLIGNELDNILTGGGGRDIFVFSEMWGNDEITDFEDGLDLIEMSAMGIGYGDLQVSDGTDGAVVDFGDNSIILTGLAADQIDADDFLFDAVA